MYKLMVCKSLKMAVFDNPPKEYNKKRLRCVMVKEDDAHFTVVDVNNNPVLLDEDGNEYMVTWKEAEPYHGTDGRRVLYWVIDGMGIHKCMVSKMSTPEPKSDSLLKEFWAVVNTITLSDGTLFKQRVLYVGTDKDIAHAKLREAVYKDLRENKLVQGKLVHDTSISYVDRVEAERIAKSNF